MKSLYLDCASGISGDMLVAALVDGGVPLEALQNVVDSLHLGPVRLEVGPVQRRGFRALAFLVHYPEQRAHRHLSDIQRIVERGQLSEPQRRGVLEVFRLLAEAEARVHGTAIERVHFHEVGAVDSIVDIVCAVVAIDLLAPDFVGCSPIPTGGGTIEIAHGTVAVPAPATAELLKGVPLRATSVEAELTTPTGAALLRWLEPQFGPLPSMQIEHVGYGAGSRDLAQQANLLRVLIGASGPDASFTSSQTLIVVQTHVDDVTGQAIGDCTRQLLETGVADVYTTPIYMKKGRPGTLLTVLCRADQLDDVQSMLFELTGTLGVRHWSVERRVLERQDSEVETPWGSVRGKRVQLPDGRLRFVPEFDDCRRLAADRSVSPLEIWNAARGATSEEQKSKD